MPKISVILPTYQHHDTVSRAVRSVLEQTYQDFELIIVDDGSNDGTHEILQEYARNDHRIVLHRHEDNSGCPAKICNDAVRNFARGEYIAFQFDDDFWFEWCLEQLMMSINGYDFVYGKTIFIDDRTKDLLFIKNGVKLTRENIITDNHLANNAVLMRRSVFLELEGFDPHPVIKRVCDWELWIRMVYAGYKTNPVPAVVSICYPYRPHSVGVTSTYNRAAVQEYIQEKIRSMAQ